MPIARELQQAFDSWEELGKNYLIGRRFWSYKETIEDSHRYRAAYQILLDVDDSPWNLCPWEMDLSKITGADDNEEVK